MFAPEVSGLSKVPLLLHTTADVPEPARSATVIPETVGLPVALPVPSALKREGVQFGQLLKVSPTEAVAKIGSEILLLKGTSKGLKFVGKVTGKASARLSPKFRGVKKGAITIPSQVKRKTVKIEIGGKVKELKEPLKV